MSDAAAHKRIRAARAGVKPPQILDQVAAGRLHLSGSGAQRYKVQFTASEAWVAKLAEAQALLNHQIPDGDMAEVLMRGLQLLCAEVKKQRFATGTRSKGAKRPARTSPKTSPKTRAKEPTSAPAAPGPATDSRVTTTDPRVTTTDIGVTTPRPRSRHIPNAVKRAVFERDGQRCTFTDALGRRCSATRFLELHHRLAFARGGPHEVDNIEVRCRAHNQRAARQGFGALPPLALGQDASSG